MNLIDYSAPGCICAQSGMGPLAACKVHGERSGFGPISTEPEYPQGVDVIEDSIRLTGMGHKLTMGRDFSDTGWVIGIDTGRGTPSAACNIPDEQARVLIEHLQKFTH